VVVQNLGAAAGAKILYAHGSISTGREAPALICGHEDGDQGVAGINALFDITLGIGSSPQDLE